MSGDANVVRLVGATAALVLTPIVGAIVLGGIQYGIYRLVRAQPPMFPILILRGLMLMIAFIAVMVFWLKFGLGQPTAPATG